MSDIKMKPCPFCSGQATTSEKEGIKNMPYGWGWVGCQSCRVFINWSHGEYGKRMAVGAWNTRKPMERIVERLGKLKGTPSELQYRHLVIDEAIEIVRKGGAE